jgi:hypothetical protein
MVREVQFREKEGYHANSHNSVSTHKVLLDFKAPAVIDYLR